AEKQAQYDAYRKQIEAEVKRKAQEGIALTNPNAANQSLYDQKRSEINQEIQRKASAGIPLSNPNPYNQAMYDSMVNSQLPAKEPQVAISSPNSSNSSAQSYIDQLNAARQAATLSQLAKSRDAALSNLGAERANIAPRY